MHLFLRVQPLHEIRRPRLKRRERCSVSGAMDYQQKLAEKLIILNERGNGVLIRMNYIKKVRESRTISFGKWSVQQKREKRNLTLDLMLLETDQNLSVRTVIIQHNDTSKSKHVSKD